MPKKVSNSYIGWAVINKKRLFKGCHDIAPSYWLAQRLRKLYIQKTRDIYGPKEKAKDWVIYQVRVHWLAKWPSNLKSVTKAH